MRRPHESDFGDATEADRWFSIGDSANDRWVFECFAAGVGAANPMQWVDAPGTWRACLSKAECAAGFAEVTWRVVAARRAADAS